MYNFVSPSGVMLFSRNDIESGEWAQQDYTINACFPYVAGKVIQRGQRIYFRDPVTNGLEVYEIRNVQGGEPDHYQQIICEHIAVSELSDEHINTTEITDKTAGQALTTVLTGTLWSLGTNTASGTQSVDISRGSVWQAVRQIEQNYNVYITPRVVINSSGAITGRYLDIAPAQSTFRGLRLSVDKNMDDPLYTVDDTELYTALYGYGGSVDVPQSGGAEDQRQELTFKDVVWTQTADHPAKPAGQTYLEDATKTALYGRNGRARFGYYQNSNIKDPNILLQKTWETLKTCSNPKVTISGTVAELKRLGYTNVPLRLHDAAIVGIRPQGVNVQLEIIKLTVDLVNPLLNRVEIGAYIPNIIYINREDAKKSGGGGGGGGHGQTNKEHEDGEFYQEFVNDVTGIGMVVGKYNGGWKIKAGEITLAINEDGGTTALLDADTIDIGGVATAFRDYGIVCGSLNCVGSISVDMNVTAEGNVTGLYGSFSNGLSIGSNGLLDCYDIDCADVDCSSLHVDGYGDNSATWQTETIPTFTFSQTHNFVYRTNGVDYTTSGKIIGTTGTKTIHYLGSATT